MESSWGIFLKIGSVKGIFQFSWHFLQCVCGLAWLKIFIIWSFSDNRVVRNISVISPKYYIVIVNHLEHVSLMRKEDILSFVATWMDLEYIMLSEINQTEKDRYCMISLICGIL